VPTGGGRRRRCTSRETPARITLLRGGAVEATSAVAARSGSVGAALHSAAATRSGSVGAGPPSAAAARRGSLAVGPPSATAAHLGCAGAAPRSAVGPRVTP
jgi:hypothetical protein